MTRKIFDAVLKEVDASNVRMSNTTDNQPECQWRVCRFGKCKNPATHRVTRDVTGATWTMCAKHAGKYNNDPYSVATMPYVES